MLHEKEARNKKASLKKKWFWISVSFNALVFALVHVFPHFLQEWMTNINKIIIFLTKECPLWSWQHNFAEEIMSITLRDHSFSKKMLLGITVKIFKNVTFILSYLQYPQPRCLSLNLTWNEVFKEHVNPEAQYRKITRGYGSKWLTTEWNITQESWKKNSWSHNTKLYVPPLACYQ